jgi:hypothetical protein
LRTRPLKKSRLNLSPLAPFTTRKQTQEALLAEQAQLSARLRELLEAPRADDAGAFCCCVRAPCP